MVTAVVMVASVNSPTFEDFWEQSREENERFTQIKNNQYSDYELILAIRVRQEIKNGITTG